MARFRKNDFLKWAQKIKSVFCFIPHTHEGCDWADARISDMVKEFQSTHTKDVPLIFMHDEDIVHVSIHTPTKGVTSGHSTLPSAVASFNPHTHEGCDERLRNLTFYPTGFNPHTHEGCDTI